ncbi:DUF5719 family protein [Cellulomonas fimi]|uniref:Uncharacterized protein n=1 Tax=Cellulomonas fimi (strain ATCC 484 / DSM 20113 / JCM 1341 / CCUG 24087 / LMG 16345 / NBRC 15513 / NCIMB 8980 / NCTC 7547 / NRS-133) TaxID=590998 RepID=F4H4D9_CELFA|nr:DUF5719 family protein [Cellulomonas fimi]AEE46615.1 hypothetical protein Celf_2489 [Cellulomonas fimi ATCC 484]NNH08844.1 hypothetical protein [Cellulomonas fimi]VEH33674.1 Uncharacterised protein [Cellulomonas fimi]
MTDGATTSGGSVQERTWRGRLARSGTAVAVVGLVAAVVVAGGRAPADGGVDGATGPGTVTVPPSATTLVCAGPLILPDDAGRGDSAFDPTPVDPETGAAVVASTHGGGTVTSLDGSQEVGDLSTSTEALVVDDVTAPLVVRALPEGDAAARVGAVSSGLVTAGDLRGLSAASCSQAVADAWLVGGATDLTSTAQLVLANAGSTPAEVTLEIWGPAGPVDLTGEHYLVAPGTQRVVPLGGIAAEQRRLAVHVATTGGRVAAHVQDSALDGFTPAGTDLVVPGAAPSRRQVVPGVSTLASEVGDEDAGALRLLVPGDVATSASVSVLGPDGAVALPGAQDLELVPGEVTDVPLGGLPAGAWTVVVDAAEPVVAAAVVSRPGEPGELDDVPAVERAWAPSATPSDGGVVVVPDGTSGTLVLTGLPEAGGDADSVEGGASTSATLRLLGDGGTVLAERRVTLAAGTTGAWRLDALLEGEDVLTATSQLAQETRAGTVRAVDVEVGGGSLAWAVVAEVTRTDGVLLSVLAPVPAASGVAEVAVQQDERLGTR